MEEKKHRLGYYLVWGWIFVCMLLSLFIPKSGGITALMQAFFLRMFFCSLIGYGCFWFCTETKFQWAKKIEAKIVAGVLAVVVMILGMTPVVQDVLAGPQSLDLRNVDVFRLTSLHGVTANQVYMTGTTDSGDMVHIPISRNLANQLETYRSDRVFFDYWEHTGRIEDWHFLLDELERDYPWQDEAPSV
jgi:hypothetical protein